MAHDIDAAISALYNSPLDAVSWSLRGLICAPRGARLIAADYSNIEGRTIAWLAGEAWKVQAFRDYDTFTGKLDAKGKPERLGPDLYLVAAGKILGLNPADVSKPQRQAVGKPAELGLGFGGAVGAILTMMRNGAVVPWLRRDGDPPAKITLDMIAEAVSEAVPAATWADAAWKYQSGALEEAAEILAERRLLARLLDGEAEGEGEAELATGAADDLELIELTRDVARRNRYGLGADHWTALRVIVDMWRASHPRIVAFWRELEHAAIAAIERPGSVQQAGAHIRYSVIGNFLYCRLPSGRCLAYPYPRVIETEDKKTGYKSRRIEFDGVDSKTKRWGKQRVYGGLLAENVTQAVARDMLASALKRLKARGYVTVLHVHDEIVCEMLNGRGSLKEMSAIMSEIPTWAAGLPVAVDGWSGIRYRK